MPELPEVETTRRGIQPHLLARTITDVVVRQPRLRWPVPEGLSQTLSGQIVRAVQRRGKYLLLRLDTGTLILHLGMSGSLRVVPLDSEAQKHDHLDLRLDSRQCLRLRDPRRFGAVLWTDPEPWQHPLLRRLGPEPLSVDFNAEHLQRQARGRRVAIKSFIMDSQVVVGVGNIYANEALFMAGIHPKRLCSRIAPLRYRLLEQAIKQVLRQAIEQGGTTLRDFSQADGNPGYFTQSLKVYGKDGQPCPRCARPISQQRIGQRSSFYCAHCQR